MTTKHVRPRRRCVVTALFPTTFAAAAMCVAALLPAVALAQSAAPQFCSGRGIDTATDRGLAVQLARAWRPVLDERFQNGLADWQITNYQKALQIVAASGSDDRGLLIHRPGRETDTAFELASRPIAIVSGRLYRLAIEARHSLDLSMAAGHGTSCWNQIRWLAQDGREVAVTPFQFRSEGDAWYELQLETRAPSGATSAVVRIGFDSPNLFGERLLRVRQVTLSVQEEPPRYVAEGELLSRPQRLAGTVERAALQWQAVAPQDTGVKFQVRSAVDADGGPQEWTPFCGPDGEPGSFFTVSGTPLGAVHRGHPWLQYRVLLDTRQAKATPVLRQVRLGEGSSWIEDHIWSSPDAAGPYLADCRPRRTGDASEPLRFSLVDNAGGVGVDRHSLEVFLDGRPVTSLFKRIDEKTFACRLSQPLRPFAGLPGLDQWTVSNYTSALTIRSGAPRGPGGADCITVGRRGPQQDTAFALVSPRVSVSEGAEYQVGFWSRHTMDLTGAGGKGEHRSGFSWLDAEGRPIGEPVRFDLGRADPAWHEQRMTLVAPPRTKYAVMQFGWDYPDIADGGEAAFADPRLDGPHPESNARPNVHRVSVRAMDLAGNAMSQDWWISVQEPPKKGIVNMRDDGVVLVDGKPLFPIGLYAVWKREHNGQDFQRCFAELKAAGFNTAHTYQAGRGPELDEFFAVAERHGFHVIVAPQGGANQRDPQNAVSTVAAECQRPALLAWYLADDTASHISAEQLRRVHRAIRDVDPFHVTVQADGVHGGPTGKSRYTDYVDSTDAFLPELYPIRSDKQHEVAEIIRDMKAIAADLKRAGRNAPVWAIIQDFEGWGWQRFPTDAEVRAMTYLAIIHGATGMTYYTYGGHGKNYGVTHDPKVWDNLKRIAGQLASLHDVLVQRDPPQEQKVQIVSGRQTDNLGYPAISTRLKLYQGKRYLLAANSAESPVRAKIAGPAGESSVEVLFEDRHVSGQSGVWEDDFAPHAVHVYCW